MYFFYIVRCGDGSLYCGQTSNLKRRLKEHNSKTKKSAKYTRSRQPVELVYVELCQSLQHACRREYEVKTWTKLKKEVLVARSHKKNIEKALNNKPLD